MIAIKDAVSIACRIKFVAELLCLRSRYLNSPFDRMRYLMGRKSCYTAGQDDEIRQRRKKEKIHAKKHHESQRRASNGSKSKRTSILKYEAVCCVLFIALNGAYIRSKCQAFQNDVFKAVALTNVLCYTKLCRFSQRRVVRLFIPPYRPHSQSETSCFH